MKKHIFKVIRTITSNRHMGKTMILSIAALLLVSCLMVSVTYSWVETVSSIKIYTDTDTSNNYADMKYKITNEVDYSSVKVTGNTELDLAEFFKKSGNMHFTPVSSANGKDFYFPKLRYSGGNQTFFRKGNVSDRNVNYLSICLKVTTESTTGSAFYFENNGNFFDDSHMRISVSSKVDGTDTEETKIFAGTGSTAEVVNAVDGSKSPTTVYPISDYYNSGSNAGNKTLLSLEKNQTKIVTINIWYQYSTDSDASTYELSKVLDINQLKIICKDAPKRVTFIPTGLWNDISGIWYAAWVYDNSGSLTDAWVSVRDNGDGSYTCEFDSTYRKLVFARFESDYSTPSFSVALNQTVDITIGDNAAATYFINGLSNETYTRQLDNTTQTKYAIKEGQPAVVYLDFVTGCDDQSYATIKLTASNHNMYIEKTYDDVQSNTDRYMLVPGGATIALSSSDIASDYSFEGWYSDKAGTQPLTGTALTTAPAEGEIRSYYAKFEPIRYYLGGKIDNTNVTTKQARYELIAQGDGTYCLSDYTFTAGDEQTFTVIDGNNKVYHPATDNAGSNTAAAGEPQDISTANSSNKWKLDVKKGVKATITWNPSTKKLSWTSEYTIYFKNVKNWQQVHIYLHTGAFWDSNGCIPKNASVKAQMTYDSANQVYKYTVSANGTVPQYSYVAFCKDNQYNYDNFYATEASYRGDLSDYTKPKFTPDTTSNGTWNTSVVYYSNGSWSEL